jgi:hypothetical protein
MSEPLLTIRNHHSPACGDPPIVNEEDRDTYVGYLFSPLESGWLDEVSPSLSDVESVGELGCSVV